MFAFRNANGTCLSGSVIKSDAAAKAGGMTAFIRRRPVGEDLDGGVCGVVCSHRFVPAVGKVAVACIIGSVMRHGNDRVAQPEAHGGAGSRSGAAVAECSLVGYRCGCFTVCRAGAAHGGEGHGIRIGCAKLEIGGSYIVQICGNAVAVARGDDICVARKYRCTVG